MTVELTKEADAMICVLYREYLTRREHKVSIDNACLFHDDCSIHENFFPQWPLEDVTAVCWQLHRKKLLHASRGDNHANNVFLTEEGIIYMEGRFGHKLEVVADWIGKLAGLIGLGL